MEKRYLEEAESISKSLHRCVDSSSCDCFISYVAAALSARDQKHQREVVDLRKSVEGIALPEAGRRCCIDHLNEQPETECDASCSSSGHRAKLLALNAFDSTRRKQLAEEEGGKE